MTYQVVSSPRAGSSLLNHYCIRHNDGFGFHELFLKPANTEFKFLQNASSKQKFEFLEYYKKQDIHFSIKVFPHRIISEGYENRLLNYLDSYKILTINRDLFDMFLSYSYQDYTHWKLGHRTKDNEFASIDSFEINLDTIKLFCDQRKADLNFIGKLNVYKTFEYAELNILNLNKYFNIDFKPFTMPSGVDYKNIAINYNIAKEIFYHEMYRPRNRDYN